MGYGYFWGKGAIAVNAEWTLCGRGDKEVSGTGVCVAMQGLGMARMRSKERERRICELLLSESCPQVPDRL